MDNFVEIDTLHQRGLAFSRKTQILSYKDKYSKELRNELRKVSEQTFGETLGYNYVISLYISQRVRELNEKIEEARRGL